jgi:hypothetical protein
MGIRTRHRRVFQSRSAIVSAVQSHRTNTSPIRRSMSTLRNYPSRRSALTLALLNPWILLYKGYRNVFRNTSMVHQQTLRRNFQPGFYTLDHRGLNLCASAEQTGSLWTPSIWLLVTVGDNTSWLLSRAAMSPLSRRGLKSANCRKLFKKPSMSAGECQYSTSRSILSV